MPRCEIFITSLFFVLFALVTGLAADSNGNSPTNARAYLIRAQTLEANHQLEKALKDYDKALDLEPRLPDAWQRRGLIHFRLGHIEQSIADFDHFISLAPAQAPYHWQRGISCYYAGRFEEGRKQFELHQTVNPADVENAVWHFLCIARSSNLETARTNLIPIKGDGRVPMMKIHELFAGRAKPEEVLESARASKPSSQELARRLFYAHLYLGLYFEAIGEAGRAWEHIGEAAGRYRPDDYMGDVARVHQRLRWPRDILPDQK